MKRLSRLLLLSALAFPLARAEDAPRRPEQPRPDQPRPEAPRGAPEGFRAGFGGDGFDAMKLIEDSPELRERLGLTAEQKEKLSALRDRAREKIPALREKAEQARQTLRDLEAKPGARDEDVLAAFDTTLAVEAEMRRMGYQARLDAKRILTAEQQETLAGMVKQRRERMERAMADRGREGGDFRRPEGDRPRPPPEGERREGDRPDGDRPRPPPGGPREGGDAPWLKDDGKGGKI